MALELRPHSLRVAVTGCLLAGGVSLAHHSLSGVYDIRGSGEVTGVIKSVRFVNPHGVMTLEVPNADGTATHWELTTGSANTLSSLGFGGEGPNTVIAGDVVTITLWPSRRLDNVGFFVQAVLPDGAVFRDCGFGEFRQAVASSTEYSCDGAQGR